MTEFDDGDDLEGRDDFDRQSAWAVAEQMRSHRAWLVGQVASGEMTIDGLSSEPAGGAGRDTVKVVVLAQAVPGVGKVRARRAMAALGISEDARWGEIDGERLRALWSAMADAATRPIEIRTAQSRPAPSSVSER